MLVLDAPHARAALRVEVSRAAVGRPFLAAVEIDTDPGWHVYWRNPGDSGIPTTIEWRAPKGWRVEPLAYPMPRRFAPGGITAYGYEGRALFLARVIPSATPGTLSAKARWLVCASACVPGAATPSARVALGVAKPGPYASSLREALRALPGTVSDGVRAQAGKQVVVAASFAPGAMAPGTKAEFFPAVSGVVDQAKPFLATLRNETLVFKMNVSPFPEKHDHLPGLIVFSTGGRRTAISVDPKIEREAKP